MAEARTRDVKAELNVKSYNVTGQSKLQHLSLCNAMFMYYLEVTSRKESPVNFDVYTE
jgi:hypothetical protein